jgi:hypothetical protein
MAAESLKLIPEGAGAEHPYVKNARSKIEVLKAWAGAAGDADGLAFADALGMALTVQAGGEASNR